MHDKSKYKMYADQGDIAYNHLKEIKEVLVNYRMKVCDRTLGRFICIRPIVYRFKFILEVLISTVMRPFMMV